MRTFFPLFILFILPAAFSVTVRVFSNPVIPGKNLPDPGAVFYDGYYYVANTGGWGSGKFPIHRSKDLQNWDYVSDIFPDDHLPKWTDKKSDFWAPEIHIINGKFRAVFASSEASSGRLCVGMAHSDKIEGPYTDIGEPLIKNDTVGSIDPSIMSLSNDTHYLIWKDDGNGHNPKLPTWIKAQLLGPEGLHVSGPVYYLLRNTLPWEGDVTEAPWIMQRNDYYYLFYSGNDYCDASYAVGVARSQNPLGPYEKLGDPILKTNSKWVGPGHCSVLPVNGENDTYVMVYHSWKAGKVCGSGDDRYLMVDYVLWSDDWPYMIHSSPS